MIGQHQADAHALICRAGVTEVVQQRVASSQSPSLLEHHGSTALAKLQDQRGDKDKCVTGFISSAVASATPDEEKTTRCSKRKQTDASTGAAKKDKPVPKECATLDSMPAGQRVRANLFLPCAGTQFRL